MRGSIFGTLVLASSLILLSGCGGGGGGDGPPSDSGQIPPPAPTVPPAVPIVALSASQSAISYWEATELSWTAQGATSCDATGGWTGSRSVSGSEATARLTDTTIYNLTCTNGAGSASATITITVTPTISVDVVEAVRQAYQDRFGLSVPRPAIVPTGQTNQPGRIWTSTAYIDSNVYRLYGSSDGTIESNILPVQRPAGTFRVVVVAVNYPNTNIADVLGNLWTDAQQEINVKHANYALQLGLQAPIVAFENENLLASVGDIQNTRSRQDVVDFLAGRGISTDDFDIVVMLDLDPSNPAGGFASYGGDFAYMGYFFQASNSFEVLGLDRLSSIARAVYDHEVGHIWGWEHEWGQGAQCSQIIGCLSFITFPALFGWTDTVGDGIPEILSDSPYGR